MKHKQTIWISSGIAIVTVLAGGTFWYLHAGHQSESNASLYGAESNYIASNEAAPATSTSQTSSTTSAGSQSTAQPSLQTTKPVASTQTVPNTTSTTGDLSKLLDPTTFSQYDKYKSATSASYIDLQQGSGATLSSGQQAAVYYRGWLTNGTLFDQSRTGSDSKLQTFSFTVGQHQVISGWEEGLVGMKVGGVRLLIVPPSVGYGTNGQGPIPANAVLVFQVQLVQVQ